MKINIYLHGDSEIHEIIENIKLQDNEIEEVDEYFPKDIDRQSLSNTLLKKIANKIHDFCYEVELEFDFDPFTGELTEVKLKGQK